MLRFSSLKSCVVQENNHTPTMEEIFLRLSFPSGNSNLASYIPLNEYDDSGVQARGVDFKGPPPPWDI